MVFLMKKNHLESFYHDLIISNLSLIQHILSSFAIDKALMCKHNIKFLNVSYKCIRFSVSVKI